MIVQIVLFFILFIFLFYFFVEFQYFIVQNWYWAYSLYIVIERGAYALRSVS